MELDYSPMAALNRTYALSRVEGNAAAIRPAEMTGLDHHHLYHSLLGELYTGIDDQKAGWHLQKAIDLAKSAGGKRVLDGKLRILKQGK